MAAIFPITSLDPDSTPPPDKTIRAVVSLYWPYSSSTKQCALLLSDPDPRLRRRRGQVRVRFTAASATAVAQGRVGIGDEVLLDLRGVQWADDGTRVSTPGKSVEGELVYGGELSLRVVKKAGSSEVINQHLTVNVSTPPPDEEYDGNRTPARSTRVSSLRNSSGGVDIVPIYSSPAFVRRQRLSGDRLAREAAYDPFVDIGQELENEQPRKRQRISDVSSWRFTERSPSPKKQSPTKCISEQVEAEQTRSLSTRQEVEATVEQIRNDPYEPQDVKLPNHSHSAEQSEEMQVAEDPIDAQNPQEVKLADRDQDAEQPEEMQLAKDTEDVLETNRSLPVKLSPLPPPLPQFSEQSREQPLHPTTMPPPALARLRMPDDPFVSKPDTSQYASTLNLHQPSTPELKAVPGSALPLPSPFPQEPPPQSSTSATREVSEAANRPPVISTQHSFDSEAASDDGVRLEINPTIAALAEAHRHAMAAGENNSASTVEEALRDPASQQSDFRFDGGSENSVPETTSQAADRYTFGRSRPAVSQTDVYPEPRESGSDTEEDEVMHKAYSQQLQSHARNVLQREGIKTRDWVHQDDAAEIIHDMGVMPGSSAELDDGGDSIGTSDDNDEMSSIHDDEHDVRQTFVQEPEAMTASELAHLAVHTDGQADHDVLMIDVRSRLHSANEPIDRQHAAEDELEVAPSATTSKELSASQLSGEDRPKMAVPVRDAAQVTKSDIISRIPPQTPAKTLQSLFGFNYGMDGANDLPAQHIQATPQSEKDRIMKKTYSSLFGFRASPSPEKQDAPPPETADHSAPVGSLQREHPGSAIASRRSDVTITDTSQDVPASEDSSPQAGNPKQSEGSAQRSPQLDRTHAVEIKVESPIPERAISVQSQAPDQAPLLVSETQLSTRQESTTQPQVQYGTATHDVFGSLEVQLSEASDDESQHTEGSGPTAAPLDPESNANKQASQQHLGPTTPLTVDAPLVVEEKAGMPTASFSSAVSALLESESHAPVETDAPFDDEAFVASMLNDTTSPPGSPESSRNDTFSNTRDEPVDTSPVEPQSVSAVNTAVGTPTVPASTAPERSLGSQKVQAAPPSTVPHTSQVEVIDLDSDDESSDEDELAPHVATATVPQSMQTDTEFDQLITAGEDDLDRQSYSSTEVAPSPADGDIVDVEMQDVTPEVDAVPSDASGEDESHGSDEAVVMSDARDGTPSHIAEVETPRIQQTAVSNVPPTSQGSAPPSTQSKSIADRYRYFSDQSNETDSSSSDEDEEISTISQNRSILQVAASSEQTSQRSAQFRATEPETSLISVSSNLQDQPPHRSRGDSDNTQATSGRVTVSKTHSRPESPVEASSFIEDSMDLGGQMNSQQSSHAELPSPENSQPQPQIQRGATQHRVESQPSETQLPAVEHAVPPLLPTPAVTNEDLKIAAGADVVEQVPASPVATRRHRRNLSSTDNLAPVRRSPRKTESQSQQDKEGLVSSARRTRSQRTASPEPPQVITSRQTRSRRTATPEVTQSTTASFDDGLLSPEPAKPLRRSPRKSQALSESFKDIMEEVNEDVASPDAPTQSARQPSRNTEIQSQSSPEMKQRRANKADNSSPFKQTTDIRSVRSDQREEKHTPLTKPAVRASRTSLTSRIGHVPDVISSWFSPRRSSRQQSDLEQTEVNDTVNEEAKTLRKITSSGVLTSSAYYTPLSNLEEKLNPTSQTGVDTTIDVLAVVSDDTKTPERAKGGPRDYRTIFKLVDPTVIKPDPLPTRVEVFRPWHATLPVAKAGDVVLLRSFTVKSRKHRPYLLSTDASAWLVWKFEEAESGKTRPGSATATNSLRPTRRGSLIGHGVREETKGPPVELGDEERQRARELRAWWQGLNAEEKGDAV